MLKFISVPENQKEYFSHIKSQIVQYWQDEVSVFAPWIKWANNFFTLEWADFNLGASFNRLEWMETKRVHNALPVLHLI